MDAIEVLFAFYGALLALAAGRLLSGVARLVKQREAVRIGWMTPLLTLLLVFDLAACAANGWRTLGSADMSLQVVLACMLAAGAYYFAASLAVPDGPAESTDLDDWYRRNKRYVVGGMLVGNVLGFEVLGALIKGFGETFTTRWTGFSALMNGMFYLLLVVLMLMRNRATDIAMLVVLNALYFIAILTF
jgi:hypothetical protein